MDVTFAELFDRMTARGVEVGIAVLAGGEPAITLDGVSSARAIRYPAPAGLDRAACELVLSGRLRQMLGSPATLAAEHAARGALVRGSWPEFVELWPAEAFTGR